MFETGESRVLVPAGSYPRYISSGHLVYGRAGQLWAVGFDLDSLTVVGEPVAVVDGVPTAENGAGLFAVARDGSLVYGTAPRPEDEDEMRLVWVDRRGREEPLDLVSAEPSIDSVRLSADDRQVAYHISGSGPESGVVWVVDMASGRKQDISTDPSVASEFNISPLWLPNEPRILFASGYSGTRTLVSVASDGTDVPRVELRLENVRGLSGTDVGPDGAVVTVHDAGENGSDIGVLWPDGRWQSLLESPADERYGALSPDGRWLLYTSDETGVREVYLRRFPELDLKRPVSNGGGEAGVWSRAGDEIFYLIPQGASPSIAGTQVSSGLVAVPFRASRSADLGTPELLFSMEGYDRSSRTRDFDVSQDATRFVMVKLEPGVPRDVVYVQNWEEELKRLVPID